MTSIHPTAIVADGAKLGADVTIGPYCTVGEHVTLGDHVTLHSHVVIAGDTTIGADTQIFPFASIGHAPQDKKFKGERTKLIVGERNVIREHVTMNPGTEGGGGVTTIGNDCLFMASAHVGHDCLVGNNAIFANNATLGGHVILGDNVILGGLSAVHQFIRVGTGAFVGGLCAVVKDVVPYATVSGERSNLGGLNLVGLKRRNLDRANIHAVRHVYKELFLSEEGTLQSRAQELRQKYTTPEAIEMLDFVMGETSHGYCTPILKADASEAA